LNKPAEQIQLELRAIFCKPEIEAMITERRELPLEAQQFFGLRRDPFDPLDPRIIDDVFTTPAIDKVFKKILGAIRSQGFVSIIGEIGDGKSILKKRVNHAVNDSKVLQLFWPEFFNMDQITSGAIAYWLLRQLVPQERVPQDKISRASALKNVLKTLSDNGVRVALAFDECHRLNDRLIVALKNFWELGSGGFDRYLGVILFGQPSFEYVLGQHKEIAERCEVIKLPKLSKAAATEYLAHRVDLAGGKLVKLFEPAALSRITKAASTPLALGNVANAGLLEAFSLLEPRVKADYIPETSGDPQVFGVSAAPK
jgi:type II secretory pathway predicted ATPase ExeA